MPTNVPVTVAHGDGIGQEIMEASLHIIKEAGARIDLEVIEIGQQVYLGGNSSSIEPSSWESHCIKETPLTDAHRCRFTSSTGATISKKTMALLEQGLDIVKTESLRSYNGVVGYTLAQGQ